MKKTDLFKADKVMAERVAEFMRTKVWGITLKARFKKEEEETIASINGLKNLDGSVLADKGEESIKALENHLVELEEKLNNQLKEEASFDFTDNDKTFYKGYKSAQSEEEVINAIIGWFATYNLTVTKDNDIVITIANAISGSKKASATTIIRSGAKQFTDDKRSKGDVIGLLYGKLAERMLEVGTLKAEAIQEDVREFYAPKNKNKKESKKEVKKVEVKDHSDNNAYVEWCKENKYEVCETSWKMFETLVNAM